jgi:hypothetical protein
MQRGQGSRPLATCIPAGRPGTLRCRAPLRTGRARFRASGSSKPARSGGVWPYDPIGIKWIVLGSVHRGQGRDV